MTTLPFFVAWTMLSFCLASSLIYQDLLADPRFRVDFTKKTIPESAAYGQSPLGPHPWSKPQSFFDLNDDNTILMSNARGQPFVCTIPNVTSLDKLQAHTLPTDSDQIKRAIDHSMQLLEPLKNDCIYLHTPSDWSYEYCHLRHVRQYYVDRRPKDESGLSEPTVGYSYYLGRVHNRKYTTNSKNESTSVTTSAHIPRVQLRQMVDRNVLEQKWVDGSMCDLTHVPRTISLRFECDPRPFDHISMIQEVATCQYEMTISTPRLCEETLFAARPRELVHNIECHPIVPDKLKVATRQETGTADQGRAKPLRAEEEASLAQKGNTDKNTKDSAESLSDQPTQDDKIEDLVTYIAQLAQKINGVAEEQVQAPPAEAAQRASLRDSQVAFIYLDDIDKLSAGDRGQIKQLLEGSGQKRKQFNQQSPERYTAQRKNKAAYEKNYLSED